MQRMPVFLVFGLLAIPGSVLAQGSAATDADLVQAALSAAPASIAADAMVADLEGNVLREGSSEWVCMPDNPKLPNNSPMCLDAPWREFMNAYLNERRPDFGGIGFGYMLQEDFPVSNTNPFATGPTADNEWVANAGPHIMMIVSDPSLLEGLPTDPDNGGPWVMWKDTPYAHVMIPTVGQN